MPGRAGRLSVVATPIGNLGDFSPRAREVLAACTRIAAEDTRHTSHLLNHFGIEKPMMSLHEHNEAERIDSILSALREGEHIALVSDAGTPGISDPGFRLLRAAADCDVEIEAIPGPCAAIAALSIAGLATDRFVFEGFMPVRAAQRSAKLEALREEQRTIVLYEAPHRIRDLLEACVTAFGAERAAVVARELTKKYESVYRGTLGSLVERAAQMTRGELVLLIAGAPAQAHASVDEKNLDRVLRILMPHMSLKQAASLAAQVCDCGGNQSYRRALALREES